MFRLETLGGLRITCDGRELAQPRMRVALLARVAAAGDQGLARDEALVCFWPERDTESARHSLDQLLYELRHALGRSPVGGTATLHLEADVIESDLAEFQSALRAGDLTKAVATYRGSFLQGFYLSRASEFERWAESMRSSLQVSYQRALEMLVAEATAAGQLARAIGYARQLVTIDPVSARATLTLMRTLAASGDRAGALDWAQRHERIVRAQLETDPDPAVTALADQLRTEPAPVQSTHPASSDFGLIVPEEAPHDPPYHDESSGTGAAPANAPLSTLKSHKLRWALSGAAIVLSLFAVATLLRGHQRVSSIGTGPRLLTVIPFVNVGGDSAQAYLADGMSDELATALGKICGIVVVGRTAAYQYRGRRDVDARTVGHAMGAEFVVQGSVRQATGHLRTSVQLARTETGEELWANSYERPAGDAFAMQDEITRAIAEAMRPRFAGNIGCRPSPAVQRVPDADAYDLYLRGQYLLRRRGPGVRLAAERFDSAIARDSSFAPAYAGLSAALALFPYFANTPPAAVYGRVAASAQRALALDSTLGEPHTALALAAMHVHSWARADSEHRKALAADSTDPSAHHQYGRYLMYTRQLDSALKEFRRAESLDRYSALYSAWVGYASFEKGKMPDALAELRRALDIDSLNPVAVMLAAMVYASRGDTAAARGMTERLPNTPPWTASTAYLLGEIGDHAAARRIALSATADGPGAWFRETTQAYAALGMGDTARALSAFERATDSDEIWMLYNSVGDRMFDPIRRTPRFQVLLRRIGLGDRPVR